MARVYHLPTAATRKPADRAVVTAQDLHEAGPLGSRAAASHSVYVATNLPAYVPPSPIERRNRPINRARRRDPAEAMRRLRVAQAYNHTPVRQGRIRHTL